MNKSKKVQPREVFFESRICGISAKKMAEKINEQNERDETSEHRSKLIAETRMACPELCKEEIEKMVDKTEILEAKMKANPGEKVLTEDEKADHDKAQKRKRLITMISQTGRIGGFNPADIKRVIKQELEKEGLN